MFKAQDFGQLFYVEGTRFERLLMFRPQDLKKKLFVSRSQGFEQRFYVQGTII